MSRALAISLCVGFWAGGVPQSLLADEPWDTPWDRWRHDRWSRDGDWKSKPRIDSDHRFDGTFPWRDPWKNRLGFYHPHLGPSHDFGSFQRPYPYHLDYYRMRYGGGYDPYFGNLYGPPLIYSPSYGYATPYDYGYGGYGDYGYSGAYYW